MKKADVKVGATYRAKVSNNVVEVRIDAESPHGGWDATNLATGKKVRIKTSQRLRAAVGATAAPAAKDADKGATPAPEAKNATRANVGQRRGKPAAAATDPATKATEKARKEAIKVADANLAAIEAAENGTKGKKAGRSKPEFSKAVNPKFPKPKRTSALDAAAQVLAKATEPMTCKALIAAMAEQGLWQSPGGKTPEATLNAAIIRDIAKKRKDSRFIKAGRGLFAANPEGGE